MMNPSYYAIYVEFAVLVMTSSSYLEGGAVTSDIQRVIEKNTEKDKWRGGKREKERERERER